MSWPDPPTKPNPKQLDFEKAKYQAQIDLHKAMLRDEVDAATKQTERDAALEKADWEAEIALYKAVYDARLEVAKNALARGQAAAEFVRNASAGIVTLYTGVLGFVFGFAEGGTDLPPTALIPAFFLGGSVALAAFYVAYIGRQLPTAGPKPSTSFRVLAERRLTAFTEWASALALARAAFLRASVFALVFGVVFLPVPFTDISDSQVWFLSLLAFAVTVIVLLSSPALPTLPPQSAPVGASPTAELPPGESAASRPDTNR